MDIVRKSKLIESILLRIPLPFSTLRPTRKRIGALLTDYRDLLLSMILFIQKQNTLFR